MKQSIMFSEIWWTETLGTWMAWNRTTVAFFLFVVLAITSMGIWEYYSPGGDPRRGVFSIDTTRGDRLFISLIGTAFIFLAWLGLYGTPLWGALAISLVWFVFVFKKV